MKVYQITDKEFARYGQVLTGYDLKAFLGSLSELKIPDEGIVYEPSVEALEQHAVFADMRNRGFGGMPIQIGYVGGNNKVLNCLEYHKSSEFNIALDDVVLVLGIQSEIKDGKFDTARCEAFLVPAGIGVELYSTTLHYAPMNVNADGYRVACVLPRGTNYEKPLIAISNDEDKMCAGSNKWLMAHKDSSEAEKGSYVGLIGENITLDMLEI